MTLLATHRWTGADQLAFAALTGDWNPIHLDAHRARRELFGRRIVHGLHGALRCYESLLASREVAPHSIAITGVRARFLAPVFLGEDVDLHLVREASGEAGLELRAGAQVLYELEVAWRQQSMPSIDRPVNGNLTAEARPTVHLFGELKELQGALPASVDHRVFARMFPLVSASLAPPVPGALCAVTRLVGMECPGMQSLLSSLDLSTGAAEVSNRLDWSVASADARFSLVRMLVLGAGIDGKVEAFFRPIPVEQPAVADLRALVPADAFAGVTALVVGGSRGLGEVTAKLLAAGGAGVVLTYHRLRGEAERVAADIRSAGLSCDVVPWSATAPLTGVQALRTLGFTPNHVFYHATPKIPARKAGVFTPSVFRRFSRTYVEGLAATVRGCRDITSGPLTVFYPSTTLLDAPVKGSAEYTAAKAAGEQLCRLLALSDRQLRVVVERLPRIATDQAQSLIPQPAAPAASIMPEVLLRLRSGAA